MNAPSYDIATFLASKGVGVLISDPDQWSIFVNDSPDSPDQIIGVFDIPGLSPNPAYLFDFPSVQIMVRGKPHEFQNTYSKIAEVRENLLGLPSQDINGTRYTSITVATDVFLFDIDEKGRKIFSMNLNIIREPPTGTYRQ